MKSRQQDPRKHRSKGEQTRTIILEGAQRIIARQGLRGVTHRAVAAEAGVQLSLTTYYFKDIGALIEAAFELFCERSRPGYEEVWEQIFEYMDNYSAAELRKTSVREKLCADLSQRAVDYLIQQILEKPEGLAIEQTFFSSVQQSDGLRDLAARHRDNLLQPLIRLCGRFNRKDPEIDAELLLDTMTRLEYAALLQEPTEINRDNLERLCRRQIGWALGLKGA